jgi:tRNA threonylcarbamoyladenosine biosynthesis protein TsaB
MNLLAFDTSTEVMSIAVSRGDALWQHHGVGGAATSATLIPAILALMAQAGVTFAELDVIAFGRGPGSFTGLRTACSVAQGLAFGAENNAGAPLRVLPIDTLLAVAEEARHQHGTRRVVAMLDARMDEIYCASYDFDSGERWFDVLPALVKPETVPSEAGWVYAGNTLNAYSERLPTGIPHFAALPTATALLRLAPALLAAGQAVQADDALPRYIRDKVASTTLEREAERAAAKIALIAPIPLITP